MRRLGLTILIVAVLACAGMAWYVWPRESTRVSGAFDKTRFAQMPFGTTMESVSRALGPPLARRDMTVAETWLYCMREPQTVLTHEGVFTSRSELQIACPSVEFDGNRRVRAARGFDVPGIIGADAAIVRARLGEPLLIRSAGRYTIWYYSAPANANVGFDQITVTFDARRRLVDKDVTHIAD